MSNPANGDFLIANNVDLLESFQWVDAGTGVPINFTGSTFDMRIAAVAGGVAVLEMTTANSGIASTDLVNGTITLVAADGTIPVGIYVYDLVRITGSARELLMYGAFVVVRGDAVTFTLRSPRQTFTLKKQSSPSRLLTGGQGLMGPVGPVGALPGTRNRLINGNGAIKQRDVLTTATDDTYAWDRHNVLTQTAAIGISTLTNVANGLPSMMRLTQLQATAQRMGNSQIIESFDCVGLRGKTITLVGKFRNSLAAATRYAILEWTGTADAVTSDIVNSWTNGTFTAGQFFNSTTLNVLAVGAITPTAATLTDFLLTATVGSSANNLIVFMWTETAQAQNSTLDMAWEKVDYDATGKTYPTEFRPRALELMLCQRFFAVFGGSGGLTEVLGFGQCFSTTGAVASLQMPVLMRVTPTMSISAFGDFFVLSATTVGITCTSFGWIASSSSNRMSVALLAVASGLAAGNNTSLSVGNANAPHLCGIGALTMATVTSAAYGEGGSIVAIIDGNEFSIPDDPRSMDRVLIAEWEAAGGVIEPYSDPGPSAEQVNAERDRRTATGFVFDGKAYQLDADSRSNVIAMAADARFAVLGGATAGNLRWADADNDFGWIATDNQVTPMDAQTMVAFGDTAKLWASRHVFVARELKDMDPTPADFTNDEYWP